ncbi:MAG TPA: outer membrane beta-barrel protein [Burkholderiaceae bacterium]|nr:outer membrane beta-barrel protein [Burkholderiaceae bacterium]
MEASLDLNVLRRRIAHAILLASMLVAGPAAAQMTLTLYAGYVGSDGIENTTTDAKATVKSSGAFSLAVGTLLDPSRELQLMYSQQSTTLSPGGSAAPFDLTVRYLHLGGTSFIEGPVGRGVYVAGGIGATQFSPSTSGYGSEIRASLNLGVGYYWPLNDNFGLRAEARGFATFVNSSGGFMCSGGCVVVLRSDIFLQYEGMIGLNARF